jgi:predicted PurR-regulated permease PerM
MPLPATRQPFFIGLLGAASIAFFVLLVGFWQPIFWAAVIGIIFRPVHTRIADRLNGRESLAAVLTVILIFFTVLVPALLLASAVAAEAAGVYTRIQSGELDVGAVVRWVQSLLPQAGEWATRIGVDLNDLIDKLSAAAVKGSRFIASLALSAGQNLASFVVLFFLMLYLLFFVLRDGDLIVGHVHRAIPLPDEQERRLFNKFAEVARATVKGTLVVGLVQGFLGGLIFAVLGIQGAVFWGVVMAILSLLPAIGAGLVWGPAAIFLFVAGHWIKGLILFAFGVLVISLVDNLLRPILVGRDTKMPDYLILFSTLGGLGLVGISGFVLGPVIAALFIATWQMYEQENSAGANGSIGNANPDVSSDSGVAAEASNGGKKDA